MTEHEQLRQEIIEKTKEYYKAKFTPQPFTPGKSRVNYAGRVFDEREIVNAVEASLDFWLTEGRYSSEFARKIGEFLNVELDEFIKNDLDEKVKFAPTNRIYIIRKSIDKQKTIGNYLVGKRKANPWEGYGTKTTNTVDE